jgi:hypothetical protein
MNSGAPYPGFPVELCGVGDFLAAFLKRKPHTLHWMESRTGNPGISRVFREMWDSADLRAFSLLHCTVGFREVRLFLRKSRVESGCLVYTRSENAVTAHFRTSRMTPRQSNEAHSSGRVPHVSHQRTWDEEDGAKPLRMLSLSEQPLPAKGLLSS